MDRWIGKVAVVTGASSGIGAAIAKALVEKGLLVVGIARRIEKIEDLSRSLTDQPGKLFALRCDVVKEDDILRSFRWIGENVGPIHILVNNAGLTRPTNLTEGSTDDWRKIFDVNVMALCICTREAIKVMRQKKIAGHIIHINSVVGHQVPVLPKPNFNVYPASKHAVTALTETLRQELCYNHSPIKVSNPYKYCNTDCSVCRHFISEPKQTLLNADSMKYICSKVAPKDGILRCMALCDWSPRAHCKFLPSSDNEMKYTPKAWKNIVLYQMTSVPIPILSKSISPGLVTSEFQDNFPNDGTKEALGELNALKPDDVAEGVVYVLGTAPHVHVQELMIRPLGTLI